MNTECFTKKIQFQDVGSRKLEADFSAGHISSDAGSLILSEVEKARGFIQSFSKCFTDHRNPSYVEHSLEELIAQRVYGLVLGYEDLNDHDILRYDPVLAALVGKSDPTGLDRKQDSDKGCPLASKSTLNRVELGHQALSTELSDPKEVPIKSNKKIVCHPDLVTNFFIESFLDSFSEPPKEIILDFDATDDPLHGKQDGRFFHGYYGHYCYLPLYVFCGDHLLVAQLRTSDQDAASGSREELEKLVTEIRKRWSDVKIIVRADSGFCRDDFMSWCEANDIKYILGLARNNRLVKKLKKALRKAKKNHVMGRGATKLYVDFTYRTIKSWSRKRRVVGKAEYLERGENPRFVVTNLSKKEFKAQSLYEDLYCARGDMENRIKEQQLCLFADRTSTHEFMSNQLRLWFSSLAYVILSELRRVGLRGTELAKSQCTTIRLKLFKIGALIKVSVRRIYIQMSSTYVYANTLRKVILNLKHSYG